ncbi:MAG: ABC transporter, partial [Armatimonadetes bacterium CG17_big_fil_post_rev_8_21_14_2_50_66_6]
MTEPLALQLQDLASGYQGRPVIEDVTLGLPAGQWTTIIGPNGAGKSTLLRAIMGIAEVYAGSV